MQQAQEATATPFRCHLEADLSWAGHFAWPLLSPFLPLTHPLAPFCINNVTEKAAFLPDKTAACMCRCAQPASSLTLLARTARLAGVLVPVLASIRNDILSCEDRSARISTLLLPKSMASGHWQQKIIQTRHIKQASSSLLWLGCDIRRAEDTARRLRAR